MRRSRRPPRKVFLSHAAQDRKFATRLSKLLKRHRVAVWYSRKNLHGAQQWHDEIGKALERCDWFLIVLSPDAVKSMWVRRELVYALQNARYKNRIIPVVLRKCNQATLSWVLSSFQHVDFTGKFLKAGRNLLKIWGIELKS